MFLLSGLRDIVHLKQDFDFNISAVLVDKILLLIIYSASPNYKAIVICLKLLGGGTTTA